MYTKWSITQDNSKILLSGMKYIVSGDTQQEESAVSLTKRIIHKLNIWSNTRITETVIDTQNDKCLHLYGSNTSLATHLLRPNNYGIPLYTYISVIFDSHDLLHRLLSIIPRQLEPSIL